MRRRVVASLRHIFAEMKSSSMKWIVPAVVFAIAVLIVFQIVWLTREAKMQEAEDRKRITEAIHMTCDELEKREAMGFIGNSLDSVLPFYVRDSVHVRLMNDSVHQVIVVNHDSVANSRQVHIPQTPPVPRAPHPPHPPSPPPPPVVNWENDTSELVIIRSERMKDAMQDVMMQYVFNAGMPMRSLDPAVVDSALKVNFGKKGIDYPFESSIMMGPPDSRLLMDSAHRDSAWTFRAPVFRGDPSPFPTMLTVTIDPGNQSVIHRILPQIAFALLLTAGMLFLLIRIYREALKQKKIGDIRRDFINNMTHEFKTPLATMSLAADTIMNEKIIGDPAKVKYYAEQIKNENRKLNQQVEKVLELSLAEKSGIALHKEEVDLIEVITRAVESMQLQVEARGGKINWDESFGEMKIMADPFHLERVFLNLIDNAMKYGGNPPLISINIENYRSGVEIKISDNGRGIPREEWNLIFEPFHRVSTGDVHNVKGFGLGLSYAQSVVKEHKGSLSVTKSNITGTTFTLVLMHD